jgi:predicted DNA-binding transcriptional regulator YafY
MLRTMPRQGSISETVERYLRIMQLVPRGRRTDAARIEGQLASEGLSVTRRSVQRDLESLERSFPGLLCDRETKPYGWYWDKNAPLLGIPQMGVSAAVTFNLVETYLSPTLPRATLKYLNPYFAEARSTLGRQPGSRMSRWPKKVCIVPRGQPMLSPDVSDAVLEAVYTALLEERAFEVTYRPRGAKVDKTYEVHPQGMVVRSGALLLVCTLFKYDDVKQLVLHRMKTAVLSSQPARRLSGFDLDDYVQGGEVAFRLGGKIGLRIRMSSAAAHTLHESPLSRDQKIALLEEGIEELSATVPDTLELRTWLRSYGAAIEVLEPAELREAMTEEARALAEMYGV